MTRLYVAGPMTGIPEFNYPAFRDAGAALAAAGHDVLNPADVTGGVAPKPEDAKPWTFYMRAALRLLVDAEGVAVLPGWEKSRGARMEVRIAGELGMPIGGIPAWANVRPPR